MTNQEKKVEKKLKEAYEHIKPYMKDDASLSNLCHYCERYMGSQHDYEECRYRECFRCWLAMVYLKWETSY